MSAILELKETPVSCTDCILYTNRALCLITGKYADVNYRRRGDCPLKIEEDNLRWIYQPTNISPVHKYHCPKCNTINIRITNYCDRCGIKLLPPEV